MLTALNENILKLEKLYDEREERLREERLREERLREERLREEPLGSSAMGSAPEQVPEDTKEDIASGL